jgi:serine/threonine protein kinase
MIDRTGQEIDNYRLIKLLGTGTFGEVYLGENIDDPTLVAIKVLKFELTPTNLKKFLHEARTLFRLKHSNIVPLLDFGVDGETAFLVMEYAANGNLRQRHSSGSILKPETIITYVDPIAAALQYAHDKRLIHRDVKPANMLLGKNNEILLSDFGIAIIAHNENSLNTQESPDGTAAYMAPEQVQKKPRPASDQYALGIVVYEWLCGTRPFQGSDWGVMSQHVSEPPPLLREKNPAISPLIEQVVLKALAKEPQERYPDIQAFAQALKDATKQIEDQKRRNILQVQVSPPPIETKKAPSPPPPILVPDAQIIEKKPTEPLLPSKQPIASSIHQANRKPVYPKPSQVPLAPFVPLSIPATPIAAPTRGIPPGGGSRSPGNRRGWIILGLLVLTIALLSCGVLMAYVQPKSLPGQIAHSLVSQQQPPASITISPSSQTVQNTYTLVGANTTNPTSRQVAVHTLTGAAQSAAIPVKATGHAQHNAVAATGLITFHNALSFAQQVNGGTSFNLGGGLHIITDAAVSIPPLVGTTVGSMSVSAHADLTGVVGNIGALTISGFSCCSSGGIVAYNYNAFTGGQDAVNYAFLLQSDVNNAISQPIKDVTKQDALNELKRQLGPGEQFLNSTRCIPTLRADEPIGDQGTNVNSANVSYLMKCTSTGYDNQGVQNIVKSLLTQKASSTLSPGYVLINNIEASLINQTETKNTLSLFFSGKGIWAYQFTDAQKLQLAKAIAGKTVAAAQTILKSTPGIGDASINVNGGNALPTDYNQISIFMPPIVGLSGGAPSPSGSPTITNPTVQSGTPGSNGKGGSAPPSGGG